MGNTLIRKIPIGLFFSNFLVALYASVSFGVPATTQTISAETAKVQAATNSLGVDTLTTIHSLMQISNLSSGGLLTAPVVNAKTGGTVDLPISLIPSTFFPASLQATLLLPAGITLTSITAGPAATASTKQVSANGTIFILFGLNQNPIDAGVVAIAHLSVSATAVKTLYPISLVSPVFSDGNGKAIVASTTSGTVVVQ